MTQLDKPAYSQFNFLISFDEDPGDSHAGFQECSGMDLSGRLIDSPGKTGKGEKTDVFNKSKRIVLKRGVGSKHFCRWLDKSQSQPKFKPTIWIRMQNEDHTLFAVSWKLVGVRIVKYTGGPINAKGTDVALEELVMAYERLEME